MKKHSGGNVLLITLIVISLISAFVGVTLNSTMTTAKITDHSRQYASIQAAAEGALEYAYGVWKTRLQNSNGYLTNSGSNMTVTGPTFSGLAYTSGSTSTPLAIDPVDEYGAPVSSPTAVLLDVPGHTGWRGKSYNYVARAKVWATVGGIPVGVGVKRLFQYTAVPLFQSMYFFQNDIVFYRPAKMIVGGLVHTNADAYLSGQSGTPLTFSGNVSYVGNYSSTVDPPYASTWSGYVANAKVSPIYNNGGYSSQVSKVSAIEPLGKAITQAIDTTDSNPNNDSLHELIEPPKSGYTDPPEFASRRLFNKAGMVINISGSTVSVTAQNGTTLTSAQTTAIKNAVTKKKSALYDQREGTNVDVTSVDVGALKTTLDAGVSGFNNVLYIYDTTAQNSSAPNPKAIRLQNGGQLPSSGLTVASQNPVYVQGDYNTGTTTNPAVVPSNVGNSSNTASPTASGYTRKPSAIAADAVMFLSNSWSDSNSSNSLSSRVATDTTYNTAILTGEVPSGYTPQSGDPHAGAAQYGYSGGANNFPRFLENWGSQYCTYYGSMVQLFTSKTFTGEWDTGNIYSPPLRCWNFDTNFNTTPPPGSFDSGVASRGAWSKY